MYPKLHWWEWETQIFWKLSWKHCSWKIMMCMCVYLYLSIWIFNRTQFSSFIPTPLSETNTPVSQEIVPTYSILFLLRLKIYISFLCPISTLPSFLYAIAFSVLLIQTFHCCWWYHNYYSCLGKQYSCCINNNKMFIVLNQ